LKYIYTFLCLFLISNLAVADNITFSDTIKGKSCKFSDSQELNCDYRVGNDLHIVIAAIGTLYTTITFNASNKDEDYFARFSLWSGCVTVWPGASTGDNSAPGNKAYISPINGKVYERWESCKDGI
jgi:hypothetical protein